MEKEPRQFGTEESGGFNEASWPAAGFVDTELRCLTELEISNGETQVQRGVQTRGCKAGGRAWGMPSAARALYESAQKRAAKLVAKQGRELSEDEFKALVKMEPDGGTTNIRNTNSSHWKRWLAPEFRCVVPFTSFSEFDSRVGADGKKPGDTWFAFDDERPLAFFAGIWAPQWESVRKAREGLVTTDLFAFLTTEPNDIVAPVHPKAMPVILTSPEEIEIWMTAPWEEATKLQRPLPPGVLKVVSVGVKEDPPPTAKPVVDQPSLF
jgi:putative SOS response-associated peptidase YedK